MAHARQEFALVGYSEDLEKRPLKFVDAIPVARICSACGNIPRWTYTLLCGHIFCEPCYRSCATASECVCPLDGDACDTADVSSKEYPVGNLLSRKVHCRNKAYGCGVVLPASQIAEHVRHGCQHHATRCPTCSAEVLCRDVCAHLKSRCTTHVLRAAPESEQGTDDNERTQFAAFERKVEQRVRDLDAKLARLFLHCGSQNDKLVVELGHNNNNLMGALTEEIGKASAQTLDLLDRNAAEIKALVLHEKAIEQRVSGLDTKLAQLSSKIDSRSDKLNELCNNITLLKGTLTEQFGHALDRNLGEMKALYTDQSEYLRTALIPVLAPVPSDLTTHQLVVTGYAALKEKALKEGASGMMSEKVYLRRYLMSWGICFKKKGNTVNILMYLKLHEGRDDGFLEWPFTKQMRLTIVHPETRQELLLLDRGSAPQVNERVFSRPIDGSNTAGFFGSKVESSDIERDGYVKRDQLLLRFEVRA